MARGGLTFRENVRLLRSSHDEALAELRRCAGTQFDPMAVRALCAANPVALAHAHAPLASA